MATLTGSLVEFWDLGVVAARSDVSETIHAKLVAQVNCGLDITALSPWMEAEVMEDDVLIRLEGYRIGAYVAILYGLFQWSVWLTLRKDMEHCVQDQPNRA